MEDDKRKIEVSETRKEHWHKLVHVKCKPFIETNGLIAQFMGYGIDDKNDFFSGVHYYYMTEDNMSYSECTIDNVRSCTEGFVWHYTTTWEKRYDTCWNQLMEVVEKIEKLDYVVIFHHNYCHIQTLKSFTKVDNDLWFIEVHDEKMIAVYKAVVQFIKWYNEQKK